MVMGLRELTHLDMQRDWDQESAEALLEKSFLLIKFGQKSDEIDSWVYLAHESELRGIEGVFQAVEKLDPKAAELRRLQKRLLDAAPDTKKLAKRIRGELSECILECQVLPLNLLCFRKMPYIPKWDDSILFKRNMTQVELARILGILEPAFERSTHEGWKELKAVDEVAGGSRFSGATWKMRIHPNRTGIKIVALDFDWLRSIIQKDFQRLSLRRCLRLALALRAFQLERGRLPETLEVLTPEYLEVLPEDPITGLSLKWNREKGRIYSVGWNEWDDDGDFTFPHPNWTSLDWSIDYPWPVDAEADTERR